MEVKNDQEESQKQQHFHERSKTRISNGENFNSSSSNNGFMPSNFEMTHLTINDSNESQKELLGRKMAERAPETPSLRPPWFTEELATTTRASFNQHPKPDSEKKFSFQRSSNQIEFPSYTPEEMQSARPTIIDARNKKCTWMPNLAPEFVAQSDVGKKSIPLEKRAFPRYAIFITDANGNKTNSIAVKEYNMNIARSQFEPAIAAVYHAHPTNATFERPDIGSKDREAVKV
ncbi:unnamed protein product [Rodentolepis nana]|uniref:Uncharacterized protein n=1 Tax=Rodentolepis nana TaxID=102285 RepID=A0A0R3TSJ3_RODNA|nr:unnamed protein product [Rodentolepis nana]